MVKRRTIAAALMAITVSCVAIAAWRGHELAKKDREEAARIRLTFPPKPKLVERIPETNPDPREPEAARYPMPSHAEAYGIESFDPKGFTIKWEAPDKCLALSATVIGKRSGLTSQAMQYSYALEGQNKCKVKITGRRVKLSFHDAKGVRLGWAEPAEIGFLDPGEKFRTVYLMPEDVEDAGVPVEIRVREVSGL